MAIIRRTFTIRRTFFQPLLQNRNQRARNAQSPTERKANISGGKTLLLLVVLFRCCVADACAPGTLSCLIRARTARPSVARISGRASELMLIATPSLGANVGAVAHNVA